MENLAMDHSLNFYNESIRELKKQIKVTEDTAVDYRCTLCHKFNCICDDEYMQGVER